MWKNVCVFMNHNLAAFHWTFHLQILCVPKIRPAAITGLCGKSELSVWSKIYRILHGKSVRMVYLGMSWWQKKLERVSASNRWDFWHKPTRAVLWLLYTYGSIYFLFKNNLLLNMFNLKVQKSTMKDANHTNCPLDRYNDTTKSKRKI